MSSQDKGLNKTCYVGAHLNI